MPHKDLDAIPNTSLQEYKNILIQQIHHQLPLSFSRIERNILSIPCTESQFFAIFAEHIHQFSNNSRGQKCYNQNQQTYIVFEWLSNQPFCSNIDQNQDDINPIEL
ncbi:9382_t:CDS:2, partial [Cetraspora pellucida]